MLEGIKKFLAKPKENAAQEKKGLVSNLTFGISEKSEKFSQLITNGFSSACEEYFSIKEKCQDLHTANFNLGNKHLEKGNLSEAIFRFRFIKKFWPDDFDAHYQLAYCLVLKNKYRKARAVLEELLEKEPNYNPIAKELLAHLNQVLGDA